MLNEKLRERLRKRRGSERRKNVANGKWRRRNAKPSRSVNARSGKRGSSRRGGKGKSEIVRSRRNEKPRRELWPLPDASNRRKRNARGRLVRRKRGLSVNASRRRRPRRRRKPAPLNNLANRMLVPLRHLVTLQPLVRPNAHRNLRRPRRR